MTRVAHRAASGDNEMAMALPGLTDEEADPGDRPLVVTGDDVVSDQLSRLCAAASVNPERATEPGHVRRRWPGAPLVLVGADLAAEVAALDLPVREGVVLVWSTVEPDASPPADLWRLAVAVRAEDVAVLPGGQQDLIRRLNDVAEGAGRPARTQAVVGGCGGAGASTLAAALALTAARRGERALLVDGDPLGGGIDLVVGCEDEPGLRWPEVTATEGRVNADALRAALPTTGGLAVLSWRHGRQDEPDPDTIRRIVDAGRRGAARVVTDLPRRLGPGALAALPRCDTLFLVVLANVRATASASAMLSNLHQMCTDVRVVVREAPTADLSPQSVADTLGLPLAGVVPTSRAVARAITEGAGPLARGRLERVCTGLLTVGG